MAWRLLVLGALALVAGCALERAPIDTTGIDASRPDAGRLDASTDVGPVDSGPDVGPIDAGPTDVGPDAGPLDAGPRDGGPPDAGPPDAGPPDAGPRDGGPPDAGPPDAGPPDAGPPDAGPPALRSCAVLFGSSPGYISCSETATDCTFYYNPSGGSSSCSGLCDGIGSSCSATLSEGSTDRCVTTGNLDCGTGYMDMVCVCARIP